jgi:H-type lectin domain-containing protein
MTTRVGNVIVFSQWPNGPMWTGNGPRSVVKTVTFPAGSFGSPPQVTGAISSLDSGNAANTRVTVNILNITATKFDIKVDTWADTKLAQVGVSWVAYSG